jgi:hypothetical protein
MAKYESQAVSSWAKYSMNRVIMMFSRTGLKVDVDPMNPV